jgi:fumarate reductase subunit D
MDELTRLVLGTCSLYAETQPQQALAAVIVGIALAAVFVFVCIGWIHLFNKSYKISGLEWIGIVIPCILGLVLFPLWLALNFMGDSARAEIRRSLKDLSLDIGAMGEIRTRVHDALAHNGSVSDQDPAGLPAEARWRFTGRADDASILFTAKAYSDAIAEAFRTKNVFLSKILSWDSVPVFLAADIRLHATQKPTEPYDLDPGNEAFANTLTVELTSRVAAYVLAIRATCVALLVLSITAALGWLGFSAYKDIQVHWPSSV